MKKVLSTAGMSAKDALECWMDDAARSIFRYETKPIDPNNFFAELKVGQLADLSLYEWRLAPRKNRYYGDNEFLVLSNPGPGYSIELADGTVFSGADHHLYLLGGDKGVKVQALGTHTSHGLRIPRRVLERRVSITADMLNRPIPIDAGDTNIMACFMSGMALAWPSSLSLSAKASVRDHALDLAALTVAHLSGSPVELASPASIQLVRVYAAIESQLANPRATPEQIAAMSGRSERQINRLLAKEDTSIKQLLIEQRLAKARELLAYGWFSPIQLEGWHVGRAEQTIHEIAAHCGFKDADSLRRAFKNYYGETPADYRARRTSHVRK